MQLTRIEYKNDKTTIEWDEQVNENDVHGKKFQSFDPPMDTFKEALQDLAIDVCQLCEIPEEQVDRIKVRSVSIFYKAKGNWGAVITAMKQVDVAPSPVVLNTPALPIEPYNSRNDYMLPWETHAKIERLKEEAILYIEGNREQTEQAKIPGMEDKGYIMDADDVENFGNLCPEGIDSVTISVHPSKAVPWEGPDPKPVTITREDGRKIREVAKRMKETGEVLHFPKGEAQA